MVIKIKQRKIKKACSRMPTSKTIEERKAAIWGVTVGVLSMAQPVSAQEPGHLGENHYGREGPVTDSIPTPGTAVTLYFHNTVTPQDWHYQCPHVREAKGLHNVTSERRAPPTNLQAR